MRVNEACYPMASSFTVQNLFFCDGTTNMHCSLLSEDVYRNPYAEKLMDDTVRQVWDWISRHWAMEAFLLRKQRLK